jgi:peptidoglycan/xylan/chitin deacetylase (PgdA/CDA1 family)
MFKRFLVLVCCLVLFVSAFFIHEWWSDARLGREFRAERERFHVEGQDLVVANPPASEPLTPAPSPLPVVSSPSDDGGAPATNSSAAPPASGAGAAPVAVPLDSNTLIGPVPPASVTPDAAPTDTNAPANPPATNSPDSTRIYPGPRQLPLVLLGAYHLPGLRVQETGAAPATPAVPAPPVSGAPSAGTNAATVPPTPAPSPATTPEPAATHAMAASVIVLGFHQFTGPGVPSKNIYSMRQDVFDTEMKYLKDNHYNVVPLADVVAFAKRQISLPPDTVAITIDDGYKSAINFAAPVLKKYNFPWTFFIYPAFVTRHESRGAASWPDLVELQKEGVDIECHSMTHPQLTKHGSKTPEEYDAWLTNETVNSKAILEKELGKTIKFFAYPYGAYNKVVEAKTIAAGYEAIFTVANNPIHPGTNVYAMGRYIITQPVEKSYVSYLRQGALGLADINPPPGSTVTDPRPVISAVLGYAGRIDPKSIVADVRDMGEVRYDFDPKASTIRLYLPRDLIDSVVIINIHARDAETAQTMVASWRFNYQPTAAGIHAPIGAASTPETAKPALETTATAAGTNQPAAETTAAASQPTAVVPSAGNETSNATPAIPAVPAESTPTNAAP